MPNEESRWDLGIEIPKLRSGVRSQLLQDLLDMPVGASKFFIISGERLHGLISNAKYHGRRYTRRKLTEDGIHGYRVWRIK